MITIYQKTIKDKEMRELEEFRVGSWVNAQAPSEEEVERLGSEFLLEKDHLKDALDPYEVPRLEVEEGNTYIFTRFPYRENDEVFTAPLLVIVGENFVITISTKPMQFLKKFTKGTVKFSTTQKTKLVLQFFREINAQYNLFLTNIGKDVRRTRIRLEDISNNDIARFVVFENTLNDFVGTLIPVSSVLDRLLSGKFIRLFEEDKELVEDLLLSSRQLIERGKSTLKTIVNIRNAYSTIMTHNLNRVIRLLTALTIVLTIPTIVASIYGMNVGLPFADSPLAFAGVLGIAFAVSVAVLLVFVWRRWL